jgi:hypothetical protein
MMAASSWPAAVNPDAARAAQPSVTKLLFESIYMLWTGHGSDDIT